MEQKARGKEEKEKTSAESESESEKEKKIRAKWIRTRNFLTPFLSGSVSPSEKYTYRQTAHAPP